MYDKDLPRHTNCQQIDEVVRDLKHLHRSIRLDVFDYKCLDQAGGPLCDHEEEVDCIVTPTDVCGHCYEIAQEIDDEAEVVDSVLWPCLTVRILDRIKMIESPDDSVCGYQMRVSNKICTRLPDHHGAAPITHPRTRERTQPCRNARSSMNS